jgi:alkylated DNA repair dioxygenase AlkB
VCLGRLALAAAAGDPRAGDGYTPDAALVNYYDRDALLGMHQDKIHPGTAPAGCGLTEGRINITMRVTGLE